MLMNPEEGEEFSSAEKSIVSAVKTAAAGFSVNFEMQKWMRRLFFWHQLGSGTVGAAVA